LGVPGSERSGIELRLRHQLVNIIYVQKEFGGVPVPRLLQGDAEIGADLGRISSEHDHAVRKQHGFLDIVGDEEDTLGRYFLIRPQLLTILLLPDKNAPLPLECNYYQPLPPYLRYTFSQQALI